MGICTSEYLSRNLNTYLNLFTEGYRMSFNFSPSYNFNSGLPFDQLSVKKSQKQKVTGKQRQAANERERKRMNSINQGFNSLRCRLPTDISDRKLSKVDTLRQAMKYIQYLKSILEENENTDNSNINVSTNQQKILIEQTEAENPPSIYMVSWKRLPEEYGDIHESSRGPVVFQKNIWQPSHVSSTYPDS